MPLANWMIPELTLSAEAQLEHQKRVLAAHGATNIESTIQLAISLLEQDARHRSIICKATAHIAELELFILLHANERRPSLLRRLKNLISPRP